MHNVRPQVASVVTDFNRQKNTLTVPWSAVSPNCRTSNMFGMKWNVVYTNFQTNQGLWSSCDRPLSTSEKTSHNPMSSIKHHCQCIFTAYGCQTQYRHNWPHSTFRLIWHLQRTGVTLSWWIRFLAINILFWCKVVLCLSFYILSHDSQWCTGACWCCH